MLHLETWAGRRAYPVEIVKETRTCYLVRLKVDCLRGRAGKEIYVPKYAVTTGETS
jgi:hypothetical protein